ncbi:unnamed protein product [Albugo candida]|uniref:Uncharacterized protein n=1 Tax=Albugo candida TaxID=65357 RepID=A0A024G7A4_9STRA|nr:unnamed protein product [Albugo candida]|eukprot:CCI42638.1 unnamed protein product [Albugo candida]
MDLRRWRMPPAHYSKKVDDYKQKLNYNQSSRSHPMLLNNESCELGTCDSKLGIYNLPRHNTTTSLGYDTLVNINCHVSILRERTLRRVFKIKMEFSTIYHSGHSLQFCKTCKVPRAAFELFEHLIKVNATIIQRFRCFWSRNLIRLLSQIKLTCKKMGRMTQCTVTKSTTSMAFSIALMKRWRGW